MSDPPVQVPGKRVSVKVSNEVSVHVHLNNNNNNDDEVNGGRGKKMISSFVTVIEDTKALSLSDEKERSPQHKPSTNPSALVTQITYCGWSLNSVLLEIFFTCLKD